MKLVSIKDARNKFSLKAFDCGNRDLNIFLYNFAYANDRNGIGKTYVLVNKNTICGFFTLASSQIKRATLIGESDTKLPRYPIPAIRLARLAVDKRWQKRGLGAYLLKEALIKIINASNVVGIYLIVVEPKSDAIGFYEKYGFKHLDDKTYYLTLKTVKAAINI
ncbi:MAG: GNAT family N-acetyltransferase [Bacilli bacterium]|nr:GNAT family N-acetyltransferase [Bacilli bacterium]